MDKPSVRGILETLFEEAREDKNKCYEGELTGQALAQFRSLVEGMKKEVAGGIDKRIEVLNYNQALDDVLKIMK